MTKNEKFTPKKGVVEKPMSKGPHLMQKDGVIQKPNSATGPKVTQNKYGVIEKC